MTEELLINVQLETLRGCPVCAEPPVVEETLDDNQNKDGVLIYCEFCQDKNFIIQAWAKTLQEAMDLWNMRYEYED